MKKKLLGYVLCACVIAAGSFLNASFADNKISDIKIPAKVNVSKEFNQLQKAKEGNIEAFIQTSKKLNTVLKESKVVTDTSADLPILNDGSFKKIKLKYITTADAISTLDKVFSGSSSGYGSSSTQNIKYFASDQTNSIVLTGDATAISKAEAAINNVDEESTKIMIQCVLTTLDSIASKQIGAAMSSFTSSTINNLSYNPSATDGMAKLTYGVLDSDRLPTKFSVMLDDLVSTSKAKIISKPYTVVKSGKVAKVSAGSVFYIILTSNSSYASTQNLEKVDTGTNMEITPTVLDNNLVSMDIAIDDSYLTGSPMPNIAFYTNTTKATTNITVKNGETIVIGGLNNRRESVYRKGFPFLRFIPLLGSRVNGKDEKDVVFFITPYILDKSAPDSL